MTIEQLKQFCSTDETRANLMRPWSAADKTYATDGRILLIVPRINDVPENPSAPTEGVLKVIRDNLPNGIALELPQTLPEPKWESCAYCKEGKIDQTVCDECGGEWRWRDGIKVKVGTQLLSDIYLEKIKSLPNAKIFNALGGKLFAATFTFDGGTGLLMPMRGI